MTTIDPPEYGVRWGQAILVGGGVGQAILVGGGVGQAILALSRKQMCRRPSTSMTRTNAMKRL